MKKKLLTMLLCAAMLTTSTVTAFAAETNKDEGSYNVPVTGTYNSGGAGGEKVCVDIIWDSMEFTYTAGSQWNPENHSYKEETDGSWSAKGNTITIKNHSNVGVNAKFAFSANDNLQLTYEFQEDEKAVSASGVNLESADDSKYQTAGEDGVYPAPTATVKFNITGGAISKNYNTEENTLGNITVTISKQASGNT